MSKLTRRDFLKTAAAGAGALSWAHSWMLAVSSFSTQPPAQAPLPTPIQPSATSMPPVATVLPTLPASIQPPTLTASPVPIPTWLSQPAENPKPWCVGPWLPWAAWPGLSPRRQCDRQAQHLRSLPYLRVCRHHQPLGGWDAGKNGF